MKTRMKTGRYMQNVYPLPKFRRIIPEKLPLFLDFAPTIEKLPLSSRKWVRAWYTFWSGVGGPGIEYFTSDDIMAADGSSQSSNEVFVVKM